LHRQCNLVEQLVERAWTNCIGAALFSIGGWVFAFLLSTNPWREAATCASRSFYAWYASLFLIGLFSRYCNSESKRVRYHVDASYWVYLLHLPIVYFMQIALVGAALSWWLKFAVVCTVTLSVCYFSYHVFVRYTFIGTVLSGKRYLDPILTRLS
jgi:peptidoglycan/LPS O-acetylase OafA/YrhL